MALFTLSNQRFVHTQGLQESPFLGPHSLSLPVRSLVIVSDQMEKAVNGQNKKFCSECVALFFCPVAGDRYGDRDVTQ